jgi:hypothetical protein
MEDALLAEYRHEIDAFRIEKIVKCIKDKYPEFSDEKCLEIYDACFSLRQSLIGSKGSGGIWERIGERLFSQFELKRQVHIKNDGIICESGGHHIVDIVLGNPVVGNHISNYVVISCKTSAKDRWAQDGWTLIHTPKLYVLMVVTDDYPCSSKFEESDIRKIYTLTPKKGDDRIYKLKMEDLIEEIRRIL